jgi:hypothetical protein
VKTKFARLSLVVMGAAQLPPKNAVSSNDLDLAKPQVNFRPLARTDRSTVSTAEGCVRSLSDRSPQLEEGPVLFISSEMLDVP